MCVKCNDNSCNGSHCKALPTGLRGPRGYDGVQGQQGPIGPQGIQGPTGIQGIQGPEGPSVQGTKGTQGIQGLAGGPGSLGIQGPQGPAGPTGASIVDTGWHDLNGFGFYGTYPKPQARRIGNVIYFRGDVVVPLVDSETGGALTFNYAAGNDTYLEVNTVVPYQGPVNGVFLDDSGSLTFNWNGSVNQSVIPTAVWNTGAQALDGTYQNPAGFKIARRPVKTGAKSSMLTSLFGVTINPQGKLIITLVKDAEEGITVPGIEAYYTSPLNYLISNVKQGQKVTTFTNPSTNAPLAKIHSNLLGGLQNLQQFFSISETYPYNCNAGSEEQVGGFIVRIDGLTSFIAP